MTDERKVKIDFDKIKPENEQEKKFFELLVKHKKIVYDWGHDTMWVLEDFENEEISKKYSMKSDDFLERVNCWLLAAGQIIYFLFYNGIDVEISNSAKMPEEKNEFMKKIHEDVEGRCRGSAI